MENHGTTRCTAFEGSRLIASGELGPVAMRMREVIDAGSGLPVLIFDDSTGEQIDVDLRGRPEDLLIRPGETPQGGEAADPSASPVVDAPRGPGRPRLGVVAREVTLLPRHWDWLGGQPGGASVALRKLVEEARRANEGRDRARRSREAAYRFMSAMAGNQPGFEEATRALFAGDGGRFEVLVEPWAADVRDHAKKLAAVAFDGATGP